jgi:transaldolase/glucose-6-phosphate isomerase
MPGASASRLAQLHRFGQSPWLDHIDRELVTRGGLRRMVDRDALGGVTTNPAIFEKAVAAGKAYDEQILELAREGLGAAAILDRLAVDDVRAACDVLGPVYMGSGGEDGFVSIEVAPALAYDGAATIAEAQRLFTAVDRPNVMIKIPGTAEGVAAALEAMRQGLNVNVTLLFSVAHYEAVADAYLDALEYRLRRDLTIRALSSVASVFVSRMDTAVDAALEERIAAAGDDRRRLEALKGRAGVANAKVVYERFRSYLSGRDWQLIAASGAKIQRLLWASTGVKDPAHPDVMYADELIGDHTVITLPETTWKAFNDHGTPARTADRHLEDAHRVLRELGRLGIDVERVGAQLQSRGVELFSEAWDRAVAVVEARRIALLGQEVAT